jgi:hypothetical protein
MARTWFPTSELPPATAPSVLIVRDDVKTALKKGAHISLSEAAYMLARRELDRLSRLHWRNSILTSRLQDFGNLARSESDYVEGARKSALRRLNLVRVYSIAKIKRQLREFMEREDVIVRGLDLSDAYVEVPRRLLEHLSIDYEENVLSTRDDRTNWTTVTVGLRVADQRSELENLSHTPRPFTDEEVTEWMKQEKIRRRDNDEPYHRPAIVLAARIKFPGLGERHARALHKRLPAEIKKRGPKPASNRL